MVGIGLLSEVREETSAEVLRDDMEVATPVVLQLSEELLRVLRLLIVLVLLRLDVVELVGAQ